MPKRRCLSFNKMQQQILRIFEIAPSELLTFLSHPSQQKVLPLLVPAETGKALQSEPRIAEKRHQNHSIRPAISPTSPTFYTQRRFLERVYWLIFKASRQPNRHAAVQSGVSVKTRQYLMQRQPVPQSKAISDSLCNTVPRRTLESHDFSRDSLIQREMLGRHPRGQPCPTFLCPDCCANKKSAASCS